MTQRHRLNRLRELTLEMREEWDRMLEAADFVSSLVATADHAIITANLEGEITSWNPAAAALFGWAEADVIGKNLTIIIPERLRARHQAGMAHYKETGEGPIIGKAVRVPAVRADGTEFPVIITVRGFQTGGGRFVSAMISDARAEVVVDGG